MKSTTAAAGRTRPRPSLQPVHQPNQPYIDKLPPVVCEGPVKYVLKSNSEVYFLREHVVPALVSLLWRGPTVPDTLALPPVGHGAFHGRRYPSALRDRIRTEYEARTRGNGWSTG
jgi:hypothetical protein